MPNIREFLPKGQGLDVAAQYKKKVLTSILIPARIGYNAISGTIHLKDRSQCLKDVISNGFQAGEILSVLKAEG